MINVPTIARRELSAYFLSPIAYIVMTFFLLISGFFFGFILQDVGIVSLRPALGAINFILLMAAPMLTMRLLAEEQRSGTLEALMTAPVTDVDVVVGKFLAAMGFYVALLPALFSYSKRKRQVSPHRSIFLSGVSARSYARFVLDFLRALYYTLQLKLGPIGQHVVIWDFTPPGTIRMSI